jgi:hypothetical protein
VLAGIVPVIGSRVELQPALASATKKLAELYCSQKESQKESLMDHIVKILKGVKEKYLVIQQLFSCAATIPHLASYVLFFYLLYTHYS